jgi:sterol desaturase/sphingolipid hydroxylase (fatty acid hydroxylase superfamily)
MEPIHEDNTNFINNTDKINFENKFNKDKELACPKNLGYPLGLVFSLFCFSSYFSFTFLIWKFGFKAIPFILIHRISVFLIDYYTSNATKYNLSIIQKNGFYSSEIFKSSILKFSKRFVVFNAIYCYILNDIKAHYDLSLVTNVIIMLILTEIYFTITHKALHRYYPEIHKLHHCCLRPSITTNIFFDEFDLFLELTSPLILIYLFTVLVTSDYFAMIVVMAIVNTWYAMDHDEYLKLPHWYHHYYINSNYGAYLNGRKFDEKDVVRDLVKRF